MASTPGTSVVEYPRLFPPAPSFDEGSDGQLLERFISQADEAAFEELVRRHAAMVLGVCQRILHNRHDAEDCFQAVFLVLIRKAASVRPREMVGNWLYGVAYRTALEARKMAARRRALERKKPAIQAVDPAGDRWQELRPILDQELHRLPDKYRVLIILCDLEGKTRKEVARQLRLPQGTVASRLARARTMLSNRLARRSVSFAVAALAVVLAENARAQAVPDWLIASTTKAAAQIAAGHETTGIISAKVACLADSVLKSMLLTKLKLAGAALLLLVVLGLGVGAFIPSARAEQKMDAKKIDTAKPTVKKPQDQEKKESDGTANNPEAVGQDVVGVVKSIDTELHTVSIAIPIDTPRVETITVDENVAVSVDGKKAALTDLQIGAPVTVRLAGGERRIVRIEAARGKEAVIWEPEAQVLKVRISGVPSLRVENNEERGTRN